MNREDFPMLETDIIYFDNGATTFKPNYVLDKMNEYHTKYNANAHRGDYDISHITDTKYENVRDLVTYFINANKREEIIFTSGTTYGMNQIIFGYAGAILNKNDEVLITTSEHAANVLPWYALKEQKGINIKYIDLNENNEVTIDNVKKAITNNTKIISLAHITNVIGDTRPIKEICKLAHENGIIVIVDAAQSIAHMHLDVQDLDVDFLTFSGHKMYGPTGVGVLYGKYELLKIMKPLCYGGGMNSTFTKDTNYELKELPEKLEAGTQNISGVIGLGAAIEYILNIGLDKIYSYEHILKEYLLSKLKELDFIELYNTNTRGTIVVFNIKKIFSQDTAIYLNKYKICVRSGSHCAKILKENIGIGNTCRISLALYNTKEEIDYLINVLKNSKNIWQEIL